MNKIIKDPNSYEWKQVQEFCESRIAELHLANELSCGNKETAEIRGMIKFAREVLDLDQDEDRPEIPSQSYID